MRLPATPDVNPLKQISPSIYEALFRCRGRAAWAACGDRTTVPQHPKAVLGICFHAVVEEAHKGTLAGKDDEARLALAREAFDERAALLYKEAHPLLRAKFSAPERLPYYNLYRERAAMEAATSADRVERATATAASARPAAPADVHAERKLVSQDGLLVGRPDLIDGAASEVVDYKTGVSLEEAPDAVSASEARQLRLYIHLAHQNGLTVSRAVIARADGRRASIDVSKTEADAEGQKARELLGSYNAKAGAAFQDAARASPQACRFCPCIAFCEAFWRAASPSWSEQCGVHLEGEVASVDEATVQGVRLMTLSVRVHRGTVAAEEAFIEQVPVAWITCDGSSAPQKGDSLRIVRAHRVGEDSPALIRADRAASSVWSTPGEGRGSGG